MNKKNQQLVHEFMPQNEEAQRILKQRADYLAASSVEQEDTVDLQHYVSFKLGPTERYGVPFQFIKEVLLNTNPTPVPNTPPWVAGVINRQGALLAIIDLKPFFHIKSTNEESKGQLIVLHISGVTCAIQADTIEGSEAYDPKNLDSPLVSDSAINPKYIIGLHQGVTAILNIEALLSDPQFNQSAFKEKKQ